MTYHFRIHDEDGLWAECIELEGCNTQGENLSELEKNMRETLNLYLEEPAASTVVFPPPSSEFFGSAVQSVEVDPAVAFAYQRLERRSNPSLATIKKIKILFPEFSLDSVL